MNLYRHKKFIDEQYLPDWYKAVIDYIENNYHRKLSLDEIAKNANYTKCHLCRLFKVLTGQTITEYINDVKMEKAKKLLIKSTLNITEVSQEVGFMELSYFIRVFKKIVGITPSEYRRNEYNRKIVQNKDNIVQNIDNIVQDIDK